MENFDNKVIELKKIYNKFPNETLKEMDNSIYNLSKLHGSESKKSIIEEIGKDKMLFIIVICILVALGFLNFSQHAAMYFFGIVFFLAGYFVGLNVKRFGLIFLFSHGLTGFGLMVGSTLSELFKSSLFTDNPTSLYVYLIISAIFLLIAIFKVIIYNLSDTLKLNKFSKVVPLILFTISVLMIKILPYIDVYVYKLGF